MSQPLSILCAQPPDEPAAPLTIAVGASVTVSWIAPYSGGSRITSYSISFLHQDGVTYSEFKPICDGSQSSIVTTRACYIESFAFTQAPYNLQWGSSIYAKVIATNIKGSS